MSPKAIERLQWSSRARMTCGPRDEHRSPRRGREKQRGRERGRERERGGERQIERERERQIEREREVTREREHHARSSSGEFKRNVSL
jgi:hypothetical protein